MNSIINPWRSELYKKIVHYMYLQPVYVNGDYTIYKEHSESYIYAYKNIAFNNLAGLNVIHLDRVAKRERPVSDNDYTHFLYHRAIENLELFTNKFNIQ